MKIAQIETRTLEMPYTKPLVTATNNFTVARGLLVTVVTDGGTQGYGYSDLFPRTGETPETAQHVIQSVSEIEGCRQRTGRSGADQSRYRSCLDGTPAGKVGARNRDV